MAAVDDAAQARQQHQRLSTAPAQPRVLPPPPPPPRTRALPVDREKTCPLLLRVFTKMGRTLYGLSTGWEPRESLIHEKTTPSETSTFDQKETGGHHLNQDFAVRGKEPKDEVQIYTWKDATLRELTDLVKEVAPAARRRDAKLSFAFVYPDKNGRFVVRPVGMTFSFGNGRRLDDNKTLEDLSFQTGDYLSVAIL